MKKFLALFILLTSCKHAYQQEDLGLAIHEFNDNQKQISLSPCISSKSCITSFEHKDQEAKVLGASLSPKEGSEFQAQETFLKLFDQDKAQIIKKDYQYIHAFYASRFFSFLDGDVEIFIPNKSTIHFRSSTRTKFHDFGLSRKRMEYLKRRYLGQNP